MDPEVLAAALREGVVAGAEGPPVCLPTHSKVAGDLSHFDHKIRICQSIPLPVPALQGHALRGGRV